MAGLPNEKFVVVWESYDQLLATSIFAQIFDSDGHPAFEEDYHIGSEVNCGDHYTPKLAGLVGGNFVVTWDAGGCGAELPDGVHGQVFDSDGAALSDEVSIFESHPTYMLAPLESGNFMIVYGGDDGTYVKAFDEEF